MLTTTLKLSLTNRQESDLERWLWHLTGVYNWAIRKVELDAQDGFYRSDFDLIRLLTGHGQKVGIPAHTMAAAVRSAHSAWQRCYKQLAGKPKLKGARNRLRYVVFPDPLQQPNGQRIKLPLIGSVKFHKQELPHGRIKCGTLIKRPSGWYLCLSVDADRERVSPTGQGIVGIDPGFKELLALSNGTLVEHPRELEQCARRLGQSQRGSNRKQTARLQERIANQRKDRNHKLSRRLVAANQVIAFSKDNLKGLSRIFGKSVASSSHYQLRSMLAYKCRAGGRQYIEVPSRNSTKTCSACGSLSGPTGYAGLKVRQWQCDACGAEHDRDINAAINTLIVGLGLSHERYREIAPENPRVRVGHSLLGVPFSKLTE